MEMRVVTVIYLKASNTITRAPSSPYTNTYTHACTHTHFHPMVHIHILAPSPFIGSIFRGTSSQSDRLDIFRSNNLSQTLRVASVSPSTLRTRWLVWGSLHGHADEQTYCTHTQNQHLGCNIPPPRRPDALLHHRLGSLTLGSAACLSWYPGK